MLDEFPWHISSKSSKAWLPIRCEYISHKQKKCSILKGWSKKLANFHALVVSCNFPIELNLDNPTTTNNPVIR